MKRAIWILVGMVVIGSAIALLRWRSSDHGSTPPATPVAMEKRDALTEGGADPASAAAARERDQRELDELATDLRAVSATDAETNEVVAAMKELQDGRRKLFDDLAAKRINAEQVSNGLHQLRAHMRARIGST